MDKAAKLFISCQQFCTFSEQEPSKGLWSFQLAGSKSPLEIFHLEASASPEGEDMSVHNVSELKPGRE